MRKIFGHWRDATAIEYGLIAALIAVSAIVGMQGLAPAHANQRATVVSWTPKWLAHGCKGAGGDLFAEALSDFPTKCKSYERNR